MNDYERQMYQILGAVSSTDAPIVFKGALITKLVLAENGFHSLERHTADIDANWVGAPPSMDELAGVINRSLAALDCGLTAVAVREYAEKRSAGLSIVSTATGGDVISMDISVKPVVGSRVYHYGDVSISGVLPTEILADKISVISSKMIFRRTKDFVDVYALARCVSVNTTEIYGVTKNKGRVIGSFTEFRGRRDDVAHAYERLAGIEGKPPFDEVYSYVERFVEPFANNDAMRRVWNCDKSVWEDATALQ
ncbi:hypothetical protein FACS189490_03870 [Clostridia bacterium]|nr:hypothetical protein FACS189490_03870 [Clostridia bacterium]